MIWNVLLGMLAAFGAVSALWVTLGALLNKGKVTAVCTEEAACRAAWLKSLGLVSDTVVLQIQEEQSEGQS